MKVNYDKTNIVHFRPKRHKITDNVFKLGNETISLVEKYRYLGCTLTEHLNFTTMGDILAEGAGRACYVLYISIDKK